MGLIPTQFLKSTINSTIAEFWILCRSMESKCLVWVKWGLQISHERQVWLHVEIKLSSISSVSHTNYQILPYLRKAITSLYDISEFRSKLRQIVTYVQSFTEQLPGLKSHSYNELKAELFWWQKIKQILLCYLESKYTSLKICLLFCRVFALNKSDLDLYVFKRIWNPSWFREIFVRLNKVFLFVSPTYRFQYG